MGVKSLWSLLSPVGRPVMLETMEGTTMAIDSSIWLYQFQATMRDKQGRVLSNAHVLGFLRRICKLLFYGMKPVFVFDGGAPALKKNTLNERRRKKSGAATSHVKLAEKLLAAQMRREALKHAQSRSKGKAKLDDDDIVYLEDIDPSLPKASPRKKDTPPKPKFRDHDPYRLPDVDIEERVSKAIRDVVPDPRLATEEELRTFIEEMRPEDFDVSSPAFRELPTEIQYEIVGDLRLKSRQTSYTRLQQMLRSSRTPMDFSKQQIKNLQQRNTLTQQLLTTTDSIGKAHISIPVRIASERNKEYVLIKNESGAGGWILGIRDDGTKQKPILIDHEEKESEDDDMEEVRIPTPIDPDLRRHRREMALDAISRRYSPKKLTPLHSKPIRRRSDSKPLFDLDEEEAAELRPTIQVSDDDDEALAFAIQESLDHQTAVKPTSRNDDDFIPASSRLETALSIAIATPSRKQPLSTYQSSFGIPTLLMTPPKNASELPSVNSESEPLTSKGTSDSDDDMEELPIPGQAAFDLVLPVSTAQKASSDGNMDDNVEELPIPRQAAIDLTDDMDELSTVQKTSPDRNIGDSSIPIVQKASNFRLEATSDVDELLQSFHPDQPVSRPHVEELPVSTPPQRMLVSPTPTSNKDTPVLTSIPAPSLDDNMQEVIAYGPVEERISSSSKVTIEKMNEHVQRSRSSSPFNQLDESSRPSSPVEGWDAVQEMDPEAEAGDFAEFMSQVKGKDLNDVRREIEDEIATLDQQRKAAMRDSEDITQQMISQIMMMLRLFGIPYITSPMEAEAQCAELVSLGLVDGIITDDSDIFLFGGERVFKNMFNQSKTVECFLLADLSRELGLDRGTLIRLAYLLGSDYVDGLPGVGPVVAMELLKEFPGEDGLHKFKEWWLKVQSGKDKEADLKSPFRQRFKKKFKDLYLTHDWPNAAVRDAYYHPTVDDSDEPFKWGLPDLDALREFLHAELGWNKTKVDELLLPIVKKMGKRIQTTNANKQGNLNAFLSIVGGVTHAPRKRQAYASKRLQQVVSDLRKKRRSQTSNADMEASDEDVDEVEDSRPAKKRKSTRGIGRGRQRAKVSAPDDGAFEDNMHTPPVTIPGKVLRPRKKMAIRESDSEE